MTAAPADRTLRRPDPEQLAALRSGCAIAPPASAPPTSAPATALLRMTGEDRGRFLQGLITCDVDALAPGEGTWGFFTSVKGRILAEVTVLAAGEALWLRLPPPAAEPVREHMLRYRIADRVEIEPQPDRASLTLAGPEAAAALAAVAGDPVPEEDWASVETEIAGTSALVVREALLGVPGYSVWVAADAAETVAGALRERPGVVPVDGAALETVRVEAGIPRWGVDYDDGHFPQEIGLGERAVSYSKGCYLGQEVVARIHYRGGVNRGLVGLRLAEGLLAAGLEPGATLLHDGRPAGRLGSIAWTPGEERWIGLSILHQRASEPGTVLEIEGLDDEGRAEVVELPFVSS